MRENIAWNWKLLYFPLAGIGWVVPLRPLIRWMHAKDGPRDEVLAGLIIFAILWSLRKKIKAPGVLFGIYLTFNGLERFMIEKIRVNNTMNLFGFHPTQAEVISTLLFLGGLLIIYLRRKKAAPVIKTL